MTLKEKVAEIMPEMVGEEFFGGVNNCPSSYDFLKGDNCPCFNKEFGCVLGEVPISDYYEDLLSYLGEEPIPLEFEE